MRRNPSGLEFLCATFMVRRENYTYTRDVESQVNLLLEELNSDGTLGS